MDIKKKNLNLFKILLFYMKQVTFSEYDTIYFTFSPYEYDRTNNELPTLSLKSNAKVFGGFFVTRLHCIYNELLTFKNTEMKEAFETSQLYKRKCPTPQHNFICLIKNNI
jgi:hypothetical protein